MGLDDKGSAESLPPGRSRKSGPALKQRKERVEALKRRSERLHRSILTPGVLRGLLPIRSRTLPYRSDRPETRDREARFRATSPIYVRTLGDDEAFAGQTCVIDLDGLRWWVPLLQPDNEAAVKRYLTHQDFPYRAIAQTREAALGGIMLDVGANTGRMSVPRVILGDASSAYCAEPDPLNYTCLTRNVRDNHLRGLVLPDNVAISSENGRVRLRRARTAGGHRVIDAGRSRRATVEVTAVTLDTWTERLGIDLQEVSFVKVDAQGSELHVLVGAPRVLAFRHIAWQIEIDATLLARRGCTMGDLFAQLRQHFTHFIDLNRNATGPRVRHTADIAAALAYLDGPPAGRTDVFAFNLLPPPRSTDPAADAPIRLG